jgi:hypothetical protein
MENTDNNCQRFKSQAISVATKMSHEIIFFFISCLCVLFYFVLSRVFLCCPVWPQAQDPPAFTSQGWDCRCLPPHLAGNCGFVKAQKVIVLHCLTVLSITYLISTWSKPHDQRLSIQCLDVSSSPASSTLCSVCLWFAHCCANVIIIPSSVRQVSCN